MYKLYFYFHTWIFKVVIIGRYSVVVPCSTVLIHLVFWFLAFYIGWSNIYIYRERERVITVKKATYLKNIFDSRLYQFIVFTFLDFSFLLFRNVFYKSADFVVPLKFCSLSLIPLGKIMKIMKIPNAWSRTKIFSIIQYTHLEKERNFPSSYWNLWK